MEERSMRGKMSWRLTARSWVKVGLVLVAFAATGLAFLWARDSWWSSPAPPAEAETPRPAPTPPPSQLPSDYAQRVVAYIFDSTPVTRQQFGEYLITRYGGERLKPFVNLTVIERTCHDAGIEVTPAEVEADLLEALKTVPGDKRAFLDKMLKERHMNLTEWKDEVIRPKLLMNKYCRRKASFTEDDVHRAYESAYGEKVLCQIIMWSKEDAKNGKPQEVYEAIKAHADQFDQEAKRQYVRDLAKTGGQLNPFGRYSTGNDLMEDWAFKLNEGEVSPVLPVIPGQASAVCGAYVLKCLKHLPPDGSKKLEDVRADLEKEIIDNIVKRQLEEMMKFMIDRANVKWTLAERHGEEVLPEGPPEQVVATAFGDTNITREQLGEYLIERYGAQKLELFVNRLVIERTCREKGIVVEDAEIEAALAENMKVLQAGKIEVFVKKALKPNHVTLYEWRHDVIWPKLVMTKLCQNEVQVTDNDLKKAFEAHFGEKVECQLILWKSGEEQYVRRRIYPTLQDEKEFNRLAKQQLSWELASREGRLEKPIARHTTGSETLERAAFRLDEGEISPVLTVPEGVAVIKCLKRIPADTKTKLENVRAELEKEVFEKKVQQQIPVAFEKMRKRASPVLLLGSQTSEEDLAREVEKELQKTGEGLPPRPDPTPPDSRKRGTAKP
jgi:hypothetical protein